MSVEHHDNCQAGAQSQCAHRYYDGVQCANDAAQEGKCRLHSGDKVLQIQALCSHALAVLEGDGEYHAEDLADQILAVIAGGQS